MTTHMMQRQKKIILNIINIQYVYIHIYKYLQLVIMLNGKPKTQDEQNIISIISVKLHHKFCIYNRF